MIQVTTISEDDPMVFDVVINDNRSKSQHRVRMKKNTYTQLTNNQVTPKQCVEAAFNFLLDREPKESILASFDISVITMYFSDFEQLLPEYFPS